MYLEILILFVYYVIPKLHQIRALSSRLRCVQIKVDNFRLVNAQMAFTIMEIIIPDARGALIQDV